MTIISKEKIVQKGKWEDDGKKPNSLAYIVFVLGGKERFIDKK